MVLVAVLALIKEKAAVPYQKEIDKGEITITIKRGDKMEEIDYKKYLKPLAQFLVIIMPGINSALQYDVQNSSMIPVHWSMVISMAIGAAMATIIEVLIRVFNIEHAKNQEKLLTQDKTIELLEKDIEIEKIRRNGTEKDIMLNSAVFNEKWVKSNLKIEDLQRILTEMTTE